MYKSQQSITRSRFLFFVQILLLLFCTFSHNLWVECKYNDDPSIVANDNHAEYYYYNYSWPSENIFQIYNNIAVNGTVLYVKPIAVHTTSSSRSSTSALSNPTTDPKNCTTIENPCVNLAQVDAFLKQVHKKNAPADSVIIRLIMDRENRRVFPFPAVGVSSYSYNELFFELFNAEENSNVTYSWAGFDLSGVSAQAITFLNVSLDNFRYIQRYKTIRFIDSKIGSFVSMYRYRVFDGDITLSGSVLANSALNSINRLLVKESKIIDCEMYGMSSEYVKMLNTEFLNSFFKYHLDSDTDIVVTSQLFHIENSILNNSTLELFRFDNVMIKNSNTLLISRIILRYCGASTIDSLIAKDSLYLSVNNADQILIQDSNFETTKFNTDEPILSVSATYSLRLVRTRFKNCNTMPIVTDMVSTIFMSACSFENGYGMMRSVNDFSEGSYIRIAIGHADSNINDGDGTLYAYGYSTLSFEGFTFSNNTARNGGAVFFYGESIYSLFTDMIQNTALNNGGALYYRKEIGTNYVLDNCAFLFDNNTSKNSGGAIYLEIERDVGRNKLFDACRNNLAYNSGGCVYATKQIDFQRAIISNNVAYNYGPKFAFAISNATFHMEIEYSTENIVKYNVGAETVLEIDIYPGQVISSIIFSDFIINNGERLKFLSQPATIHCSTDANILYQTQERTNIINDLSLNLNVQKKKVNATMILESFQMNFIFNILDCPKGMSLKNPLHSVFVCLENDSFNPIILYTVIPVSVIFGMLLTVVLLVAIFLLVRCFRNVYKKASLFDKKLKAEEMMERKINNRQLFFVSSSSNMSTPLLLNHSSSSSVKKSRLIIPLEDIEIINKIGEGGNGTIWLGKWKSKDVALKSLKTDDTLQDEEFEREVAVLNMLDHPSIVKLYGVCISDNRKFMIVEYYPRGSLDKLIYNCKIGKESLTLAQKLSILVDVATGMSYLHSQQIVHRFVSQFCNLSDMNLCI